MDYQSFIQHFNQHDLCSANIGIRLTDMGEGFARAILPLTDASRNIMGGLHGGAMATLADIAAGCAVIYHGRVCVTLDMSIRYLKPVMEGTVTASAKELRGGRHTAVIHVELFDQHGELCAVATTTMYLTDKPLSSLY